MDLQGIEILKATKDALEIQTVVSDRNEVLGRFGPVFQPDAVGHLGEGILRQFLSIKYNKHWTGLDRQPELYADMVALRRVISVLVDETKPVAARVDTAFNTPGMGPAKLSAILLVAYPDKYGVWNGTSEEGLKHLGLWPDSPRGATAGEKYVAVNRVLLDIAARLGIDLWTLDALWWVLDRNDASPTKIKSTDKVRLGDNRAKAIADMKYSILSTVKNSNGQTVESVVKNKDLKMLDRELDALLPQLMKEQKERCAITGLPFEYDGDKNMRPSADRIDSNGHYDASNVQLVCRFINFWKQAKPDAEFRRLIQIVRNSKDLET
jgi:hypothetical protein